MNQLHRLTPLTMDILNADETPLPAEKNRAHVMVFTSGKGGVGKTCVTSNVATAMAKKGARVCIFDADTGLANINILLGLRPEFTLEHVLNGEKSIHDIVIKTAQGVSVVPGATGIAEFANLDHATVQRLCNALAELEAEYDYFLIDTAAGIADNVLQFIESAPYTFLVITPEPTSLTDGFSMLKVLNNRHYTGRIRVVVNLADDYPHATETYRRFSAAVDKYLDLKVDYGGFVARDENVLQSVVKQTPVVDLIANAPASRCLYALAENMLKYIGGAETETGLADYWKNFLLEAIASDTDAANDAYTAQPESPPNQPKLLNEAAVNQGFDEIAGQLLAAMRNHPADRQALETFMADFMASFQTQFGVFPDNFRQLLFRWLEAEDYAAPQLQELAGTLEMLYMAKHRQPMHNLENSLARLIAQGKDSETNMRSLATQIRAAYFQAFQHDVFNARQEVLDSIQKPDFSEAHFQQLLDALGQAFEDRFKHPYQGKSDLLLASAAETLAEMASEEQTLQAQVDELTNNFQELRKRREALLANIQQA